MVSYLSWSKARNSLDQERPKSQSGGFNSRHLHDLFSTKVLVEVYTRPGSGNSSNCADPHVRFAGSKRLEVGRVVRDDQPAPETDGHSHHQGVYRQLAARADGRQEMTGNPGDADTCGEDLRVPRASSRPIASSTPAPRYNSTSTADGARTGSRRRCAERMSARTRHDAVAPNAGLARAESPHYRGSGPKRIEPLDRSAETGPNRSSRPSR